MPYDQSGNYYDSSGPSNGSIWAGIGTGAGSGALGGAALGPWGAAAGAIIGAGAGLYTGLRERSQAKKLQQQNPFPYQAIPQGIQQNAQQANRLALQGLPSAQYQETMTNIQRQQANAIVAAQERRSGMDTIGNINQTTTDAQNQLSGEDVAARRQNIESAYQQNQTLGQYTNNAFDWNNKQRYTANYNYANALLGAGNQNLLRGVDTGASGLARILSTLTTSNNNSRYALLGGQVGNGANLSMQIPG